MKAPSQTVIVVALVGLLLLFSTTAKAGTMDSATTARLMGVSYLGKSNFPRGIRNNNPGNIRISNNKWQGKIPASQNTDGAFEQFNNYVFGVRAMIILIRNYIDRDGLNSIRKILHKYAPTSENHTDTYANYVSQKTGIDVDQQIDSTQTYLRPIVQAMAHYENGQEAIDNDMFTLGYIMS